MTQFEIYRGTLKEWENRPKPTKVYVCLGAEDRFFLSVHASLEEAEGAAVEWSRSDVDRDLDRYPVLHPWYDAHRVIAVREEIV